MPKSSDKRVAPPLNRVPAKDTTASSVSQEFVLNDEGLHARAADGSHSLVCSPLQWKSFVTDINGGQPAHLVEVTTITGSQTVEIQAGLLLKPKKLLEFLINAGVGFPPAGEAAARQLARWFASFGRATHIVRVERDGWIAWQGGDAYIYGHKMYGPNGATPVRRTTQPTTSQRGSLENWLTITRNLAGNPILVAAACFAFASALLKPFGHQSFIVAFVGPSGIGKSTALRLAMALMTEPPVGLPTWDGTRAGLIAAAREHSDMPFILDEIGQAQVQDLGALIYSFGNGATRQRATSDGRLAAAAPVSTVTLVSGEVSTFELMRTAGHSPNGGQVARCITIPAGSSSAGVVENLHGKRDSENFVQRLNNSLRAMHGIAWPLYVSHLAGNLEALRTEYRQRRQEISDAIVEGSEFDRSNNVLPRVIGHFTLAAFAGLVATRAGVLDLTEEEITSALRECFGRWLTTYVTLVKSPGQTIIEDLRALIASRKGEIIPYAQYMKKPDAFAYLYTAHGKEPKILINLASFEDFRTRHGGLVFHKALRASGLLPPVKPGSRETVTNQKLVPDGSGRKVSFYEFRCADFGL